MANKTHYVHVHKTCPKCNGCIYECEHQVKWATTTTDNTELKELAALSQPQPRDSKEDK